MVAQDDTSRPAVGFRISNRGGKDRAIADLLMKLHAGDKRQIRIDRESMFRRKPLWMVLEARALSRALHIEPQRTNGLSGIPQVNSDHSLHSAVGSFLTRTRLGRRWASSKSPVSS